MKQFLRKWIVAAMALVLTFASTLATATTVYATFAQLSGNIWRVTFVVSNDGSVAAIDSVSVYFNYDHASNLGVVTAPAGWDALAFQRDTSLDAPSFIDLLSLDPTRSILPGQSLDGVSVEFEWTGLTPPSGFAWSVNDPTTFLVLEQGTTVNAIHVGAIPEPQTYALMLAGLFIILAVSRRRKTRPSKDSLNFRILPWPQAMRISAFGECGPTPR